jgi:hypothetical protein
MTVQPWGEAEARVKPPFLTGVLRKGKASESMLAELARAVQEWAAGAELAPAAAGETWCILTYGERKAQWGRRAELAPSLKQIYKLLQEIARSLPEVRTR